LGQDGAAIDEIDRQIPSYDRVMAQVANSGKSPAARAMDEAIELGHRRTLASGGRDRSWSRQSRGRGGGFSSHVLSVGSEIAGGR
jgi:hypothetical protein